MELTAEGQAVRAVQSPSQGQEEIEIAGLPSTVRCKVEDLKEMVDDGPITADLSRYLDIGRVYGSHDDDSW